MPKIRGMTDAAVKRLKAPATGQIDYFDSNFSGLVLRVSCGGRKAWNYCYRIGGKARRLTLDTYPAMSVAAAHDAWRVARDAVRSGRDPARPQAATDFLGVFEEWFQRDQAKHRSAPDVRARMQREVVSLWAHRKITDIDRRDILDAIDRVADRGHVTSALRLHAHLHRMFQWCVGRGIVAVNPVTALPKPGSETSRDRVLDEEELVAVWNAAEKIGYPYGPAFQLLILTGARRGEIGGLRRSEIMDGAIHLSGQRTKNGEPHIIPVSSPARALLDSTPAVSGSDFVFTVGGKVAIRAWSRAKADLDDFSGITTPWRTHDLRRTAATGLQKLGVALQVTEAVLGHTSGSRAGVVGIYQRHDYLAEKRAALESWGAHVLALVEGREPGKVLPMWGKQ